MGRDYDNGVIKYHETGIYSGYSGDISELVKVNNPDIPSTQSKEDNKYNPSPQNQKLTTYAKDKLIEYFGEESTNVLMGILDIDPDEIIEDNK